MGEPRRLIATSAAALPGGGTQDEASTFFDTPILGLSPHEMLVTLAAGAAAGTPMAERPLQCLLVDDSLLELADGGFR